MRQYKVGDIIDVTVTGIENYGFFVDVDGEYKGLVHISQISSAYVKNIEDYVHIKEKIKAQIIGVNDDNKQLQLSIKDINYNGDSNFIDKNGFQSLKKQLPIWIEQALEEIKKPK